MFELAIIVIILAAGVLLVVGGLVASRRSGRRREGVAPAPFGTQTAPPPQLDLPDVGVPETSPDEVAEIEAEIEAEIDREAERAGEAPARPRLADRLAKTRAALGGALAAVARRGRIDDETWDDLEEALILADVGVPTTSRIIDDVKARVAAERISDPDRVLEALKAELADVAEVGDRALRRSDGDTTVWMFVGVNGVGKTTTIAKLAHHETAAGRSVILAAADTFRAAAGEQLAVWAERVGADLVRGQAGADPGSVVFDAMSAAQGRHCDLVLIDTAGRLHTKVNLMEELKKLHRIVDRTPGALTEVLLVIDASTGQNGLIQARQFAEAVDVTGIVLTKLDGTAKGGIVLAIQSELDIPVKVVGVGETAEDLVAFDPAEFVAALFD